jgi:tetratricopeptide (TPR) repeat protein
VAFDETAKTADALGWMAEAVRRVPAAADFRAEYARVLLKSRQLPEAEREASRVLQQLPEHERALFTLAGVKMAGADLREARSILLKLLQLNPDHSGALENLALLADKQGDATRAAAYRARLSQAKTRASGMGLQP